MKHTLLSIIASLALAATVLGQDERASSPAFEEALVVEELEHDLPGAALRYAALAGDNELPEALRRRAWLRLGRVEAARGNVPAARAALGEAAKGTDAVAEEARTRLADPGQDEERTRALVEQARAALVELFERELKYTSFRPGELTQSAKDLIWIGTPAVPGFILALEEMQSEQILTPQNREAAALSALLWRIGGPEARDYLSELCRSDDLNHRRVAARGLQACLDLEEELLDLAQTLLSDPDPEGWVPILAFNGHLDREDWGSHPLYKRYDPLRIARALDSAAAPARAHILRFLARNRPDLIYTGDHRAFLAELAPRLALALDDVDPEVGQAAEAFLASLGIANHEMRELLLRRLPSLPSTFPGGNSIEQSGPDGPAESADLMLATMRQLPPANSQTPSNRDQCVTKLGAFYLVGWSREALPAVIEWAALGYDRNSRLDRWIRTECEPEDAIALCAALATRPAFRSVIPWLASIDPPAECLADLLLAESSLTEAYAAGGSGNPPYWWYSLYIAMARTGRVEVAEHLSKRLAEGKGVRHLHSLYEFVALALMHLSERSDDSQVRDALCALLQFEVETTENGIRIHVAQVRNQILGHLVHLGEGRVVELLPQAYALGLESSNGWNRDPDGWQPLSFGIGWLTTYTEDTGIPKDWHGYDENAIATIWSDLLGRDREVWNDSWQLVNNALHPAGGYPNPRVSKLPRSYISPPTGIVTAVARAWTERAASDPGKPEGSELYALAQLLDIRRRGLMVDELAISALEDLQAASFDALSAVVRSQALTDLESTLTEAERAWVLQLVVDPANAVASDALDRVFLSRIPVDRELLARVLAEGTPGMRARAVRTVAPLVADGAVALVTPLLGDPDEEVRVAVCQYLGMQVERDSVPDLLQVLKDPVARVRVAAGMALKDIRFYHDEKAHWDRVFAGTELGPAGAAEKLLRQAAPDQAQEIRLLAIRSLGQLGVPEALPFLIDWSRSEQPAIAQAAREAITRIHEAGD